jgi:hypothetical protein
MRYLIVFMLVVSASYVSGQDSSGFKIISQPEKLLNQLNRHNERLENDLQKSAIRYLNRLAKYERRLQRKLAGIDSTKAIAIFGPQNITYATFSKRITAANSAYAKVYNGHLDSVSTLLGFANQKRLISTSKEISAAMERCSSVQVQLDRSNFISEQLENRTVFLKEQLSALGFTRELRVYQEKTSYYRAQIDQYKEAFSHPQKLESLAMQNLVKIPAFKNFFARHSQLGSLFRLPGNEDIDNTQILQEMQTRQSIVSDINQRLGSGINVQQSVGQSIAGAQASLNKMKDRLHDTSGSIGSGSVPGFKPNPERIKTIWQRLEYSLNVQNTKSSYFFPMSTDLGASIGYKFSQNAVAGIGLSYKTGWGRDFRHIVLSHEGIGFRSFADWKMKGSIWFTSGAEVNYRSRFQHVAELKKFAAWKQSALAGLSKKYKINKYKGEIKLLYDFLWKSDGPGAQQLIFRTGYTF